jgi:hypothetical protein
VDFLGSVGAEVVAGLVLASLAWLAARLRKSRKGIAEHLRGRFCRHSWRPIPTDLLGGGLKLVSQWRDECAKCGARR